jgi:uncharacterized protein (TIGR02996 family)
VTDDPEHALLAQIVERPRDRGLRMVLADLLMAKEDVRGELIKLELEHAALSPGKHRTAIEDRIALLVAEHGRRLAGDVAAQTNDYWFAGGFVDTVVLSGRKYQQHGERLFAAQPIRALRPRAATTKTIEELAAAPHLPRLRALEIVPKPSRGVLTLAPLAGISLGRLEELWIENADLELPAAALELPVLRRLRRREVELPAAWVNALFGSESMCNALVDLDCEHVELVGAHLGVDATFAACRLPRLRALRLRRCQLATDHQVCTLLAQTPALRIVELDLASEETCVAIARHPEVYEVSIGGRDALGRDALDRLLQAPRLHTLRLSGGDWTDDRSANRIVDQLLALPPEHPLREVSIAGDRRRLDHRFTQPA